MSKPLEGIKVVEIAQEIQGPFASLVLADMGADVVKVENKETGDLSRWMLTALIGGPDVKNATVSHYFIAMNRGKRSITADLKKPDAIEMVRRMVKSYDVLVTNYRPGVLDRLGLGYDDVRKINPRIVYAQGSSWGPRGPWVTRPSRDTLAQAASGVMAKTGMPIGSAAGGRECSSRIIRARSASRAECWPRCSRASARARGRRSTRRSTAR